MPFFRRTETSRRHQSKSGIHALIEELIERDFVKKLPHKARALEVLRTPRFKTAEIIEEEKKIRQALLTAVPVPAEYVVAKLRPERRLPPLPNENESITVPLEMVSRGSFYALTVEESMIEAGIMDGDTAIIRKAQTAEKWTNRGGGSWWTEIGSHAQSVAKEKKDEVWLKPCNQAYEIRKLAPSRVRGTGNFKRDSAPLPLMIFNASPSLFCQKRLLFL